MILDRISVTENFERAKEIWKFLETGGAPSYFLSWGWVENWIASLPAAAKPELRVCFDGETPLLAFFAGRTNIIRKHLFRSRGWFVNATGNPDLDRIWIEYNGFLCGPHVAVSLADVLNALSEDSWDELYLPGLDVGSFPGNATFTKIPPFRTILEHDSISPFVDLNIIRREENDYLTFLASNTRYQINRSYRICEKTAPVQLEVAQDITGAMAIYRELVALHEQVWSKRGTPGAFCTDYLYLFHERLIEKRFDYGEIQLLKVRCGDVTLGCLYNFVYRNHVYFYQSGINYHLDKQVKPGFMVHVEAVRHNVAAGNNIYDFMGGDTSYKMRLATPHNRLIWVRVQKPLLRFKVEKNLKRIKGLILGFLNAGGVT